MKYEIIESRILRYVVEVPESVTLKQLQSADLDSASFDNDDGYPLSNYSVLATFEVLPSDESEETDVYLDEACRGSEGGSP